MLRNLIVLPDGTELFSGSASPSVMQLTLTQTVNSGQELTLGSACAAMLEATLFLPPEIPLEEGCALELYKVDDRGRRHKQGVFLAEKPVRCGSYRRKLTAFDRMVCFDRDMTQWLGGLTGWPYTLQQLAQMVCDDCGVELATADLPNGGFLVQAFTARDCTGRQLLQWIGEAAGRFSRMDADGRLEFAWYTPVANPLGPSPVPGIDAQWEQGALTVRTGKNPVYTQGDSLSLELPDTQLSDRDGTLLLQGADGLYYYQGSLALSDYSVAPIQRVQLRQSDEDVGTVYPDLADAANTYTVTANPLLAAQQAQTLQGVAATLYEQLRQVSYTPCQVTLPENLILQPGQILQVSDKTGKTVSVYIMTRTQKGQRCELECTGSARRDSSTAVNNRSHQALTGKVLNLRTDVDGLKAENRDTTGKLAAVELDLAGIRTQVGQMEGDQTQLSTELTQTAQSLSLFINRVETEGADQIKTRNGYTFSDQGLRIQRSGESLQSLLTHRGLEVTRNGQTLLRADEAGVNAVDVTVGNYLVIGTHARLEDYPGGRTACYYV